MQLDKRFSLKARVNHLVTHNWTLKLFALFLAIIIWGYVTNQRRGELTEFSLTTPLLLYNTPNELEVKDPPEDTVRIQLQMPRALANTYNPALVQARIDLRGYTAGIFEIPLSGQNVFYNNEGLSPGVRVLQINPSEVTVGLEGTITRRLPIRPRYSGNMAEGFVIQSIRLVPDSVEVAGPFTIVTRLTDIPTRPLDVQDLAQDVDLRVRVELPPQVRLADPDNQFFQAHIMVSTNPQRILLRDIPIVFENPPASYRTSTKTINVHLEGPEDTMTGLDLASVFAVMDLAEFPVGDYRSLTPKVVVPDNVMIMEQWPIVDLFVVRK